MRWDELNTRQIEQLDDHTPVILPLTATEQHGPHLPLATDRLIAEHLCRRLEQDIDSDILVLPSVPVGCSRHHMDFAGTLTLRHETFIRQVMEVLSSAARHRFTNFLLLNSHGGNRAAGQVVVEGFGADHPECRIATASWWRPAADQLSRISETGPGGVGHAGEFETSILLAIAPHLVDEQAIAPGENQPTFPWAEGDMLRSPKAALYRSLKQMSPNGAFGDPTAASREKGEAIVQAVVGELISVVTDLRS